MNHISQSVTSSVMTEYGEFIYLSNQRFRKALLASYHSGHTTLEEFKESGGKDDRLFFINFSVSGAWLQARFLTEQERDEALLYIDRIYQKEYGTKTSLESIKGE